MVSCVPAFCGPFETCDADVLQLHQPILALPVGVQLTVEHSAGFGAVDRAARRERANRIVE